MLFRIRRYTGLFAFVIILLSLPFIDAQARPVVIELFTSEGCSSCPKADKILEFIARDKNIIPLSYHVDYWDYLGHKDPFSLAASTELQKQYSAISGNAASLYTPQMVIQGKYSVPGNKVSDIMQVVALSSSGDWINAQMKREGNNIKINIPASPGAKGIIYMVGFQKYAETQVDNGENAGMKLQHINSITQIDELIQWNGEKIDKTISKPKGDGAAILIHNEYGEIIGSGII